MCTAHACGMFDIRQTELELQKKAKAALETSVETEHKQQVLIRDEGGQQ
jgi:hypothetical protein